MGWRWRKSVYALAVRMNRFMRNPMIGDIRVLGMVAGTHVIEDLGRDVPYGMTIVISAEEAIRSKDLWRALSQRCLFQLQSALPTTPIGVVGQLPNPDRLQLEARIRELEAQIRGLEVENQALKRNMQGPSALDSQKLDSILAAIQNGVVFSSVGAKPTQVKNEVADGTAPTFLPSEIKPKDMESRIEVQPESIPSDVASSAERLRKLRQGHS